VGTQRIWRLPVRGLVHQLFALRQQAAYEDRLEIRYVLSREERQDCFHGRINEDLLDGVFCQDAVAKDSLRFLSTGTMDMMAFAYSTLAKLGFDIRKADNWTGENMLFRKLCETDQPSARSSSPLASISASTSTRGYGVKEGHEVLLGSVMDNGLSTTRSAL